MYAAVAGAPVVFEDIEQETRFKSSHLRNFHGVRGGAAVVIPTASGVFGVLLAYSSSSARSPSTRSRSSNRPPASLGEAVERSYTEQALRKSESRLKQLIASTLDAVFTVDRDGIVIEWNPQAEGTFGLRASDVIGRPLPPDRAAAFRGRRTRARRGASRRPAAARMAKSSRSR